MDTRAARAARPADDLDAVNTEIVQTLPAEEGLVPSTTRVDGRLAIRPCFVNPATTIAEVDALADKVADIGDRIVARMFA